MVISPSSLLLAEPSSSEVQKRIPPTGRLHLHNGDMDGDGWDDLWEAIFARHHSGQTFEANIANHPDGDADGDGVSNYEEMLGFRNPYEADSPPRVLSPAEAKASRAAAIPAERKSDAKKLDRFHLLLESRGVLRRGPEEKPPKEDPDDSDTTGKSSFDEGSLSDGNPAVAGWMWCSLSSAPEILFQERLSDGRYLLAWEGEGDSLYDIEGSDDLVNWKLCAKQIPVIGDIGTWGQFTHAPKRFYRVRLHQDTPTIPSDPSGGDGITTFGATLAPVLQGSAPRQFLVTVNLPAGISANAVDLVIDGEVHGRCRPSDSGNGFIGEVDWWYLSPGAHTAHVVVDSLTDQPATSNGQTGGILRSAASSFTLDFGSHLAMNFRISENQIAPVDPDLPAATVISADILSDPQGMTFLRILDENENVVREWDWFPDEYPLEIRQTWDGTNSSGTPVPAGRYQVDLEVGGAGLTGTTHFVNAGVRTHKALILTEPQGGWGENFSYSNYRETWMEHFTTTGGTPIPNAWGPWKKLSSLDRITDEIRGRAKNANNRKLPGLGDIKGWKCLFWQQDSKNRDNISNPVAAFASGSNPFNDYDMGFFMGHGVASAGGTVPFGNGTFTTGPSHYYPLTLNRDTGATYWVRSASIPKYGAGGKLKWMFLMTCSPLSDTCPDANNHEIFAACQANGTLPFGNNLRVLCGYVSKIRLHSGMGTLLSEAMMYPQEDVAYRDGSVVQSWGYVWSKSENKGAGKIARAVYWPECKFDAIPGVDHEHVPPLQAHSSQMELKFTDFSNL
ncbi:hypothetical protein HNR46_000805 [Haloferula luteola]|uniref:FlgD/Vpr Ig-like domain-containing protein n=1 Tax=Haloferula luteola TaxID=595692 RepID=A0A840UWP3_9BACT|nr:FlgD immunoglobulin-like domain containing protein [Haloferula luteola]MBB5350577.1 hypothetical protein [Haloferula luteola]